MSFDRCPRCKNFGFLESHVCPPKFYCSQYKDFDNDNDLNEIYALNAERAAEKFLENSQWNGGEFEAGEHTVFVKRPDSVEVLAFCVTAELEPNYTAKKIDLDEAKDEN